MCELEEAAAHRLRGHLRHGIWRNEVYVCKTLELDAWKSTCLAGVRSKPQCPLDGTRALSCPWEGLQRTVLCVSHLKPWSSPWVAACAPTLTSPPASSSHTRAIRTYVRFILDTVRESTLQSPSSGSPLVHSCRQPSGLPPSSTRPEGAPLTPPPTERPCPASRREPAHGRPAWVSARN